MLGCLLSYYSKQQYNKPNSRNLKFSLFFSWYETKNSEAADNFGVHSGLIPVSPTVGVVSPFEGGVRIVFGLNFLDGQSIPVDV